MEDFQLGSWLVGGGSSKLRSFSLSKSYSRISWVYTCVGAIASSIGGVPLLFNRGDEQIIDPDDPVLALFNRPNPPTIPSLRALLLQTFTLLGTEGILYWVFERKKGVWTRITIKRKWQMRPVFKGGSDTELLGWVEVDKYRRQKVAYALTEVLPIAYYNPDDPFGGLAPLTAARLGIEQEYSMAAWNAAFFAQGLRNPIGIEFKRALLPKQRKDLEKSIRDYFSGIDGGQGVFMLEGDGKFCDLHLSAAKDLDFVEGKSLTREEICAVYGVPPATVGIFRYANYANSNVQRKLFWENCLLPKMAALLDLIRMGILEQEFSGVEASWDKRSIPALQKEFKSLAAAAKSYFDMGYTRREVAFILDAPELDPPEPELEDDEPEDAVSAVVPISLHGIDDQILTNQILNPCKTNLDIITNKADDQWFRDYGIAYEQVLMSLEFRWLEYLRRYFDNLGNALYRRITRGDLAVLNPVVWAESWEGMAELLFRDTCELAAKITIAELNTSGNLDLIIHIIRNTSAKASVIDSIDISKFFTTDEMTAFNHAISSYASKTVGVSNDIIGALNRRATQELLGGMTPNQLRKAVSRIVDETYRGRSLTIARTLSGGAYNSARYNSFETLGVQMHKWINSGDSIVRDTHRREGGSAPVVLGTPFPITGCRYPLDPMGKAKEVINCISDPQQPIWTINGWKPIGKIEVGDSVLTHKGRYKPVTAVSHNRRYDGPLVKVKPLGDVKAIPCTPEHRFLTGTGWKEAQYLDTDDKLLVQAKPCPNCGQLMPWWRRVCSLRCNSLTITKKQWCDPEHRKNISKRATAQLHREYANGTRNRFVITEIMRANCQDKYGKGGYLGAVRNTEDFQQKVVDGVISKYGSYLNMHKQFSIGPQSPVEAYWLDWAENHFAQHLDTQFWVGDYRVDGYIKDQKLFVEVDAYDRKDEVERDTAILLAYPDHSVLHLKVHGHDLREQYTRDLMQCNHDGGHQFVGVAIKAVTPFQPKRTVCLYNFAVEDDESYVIKGIVSHNCRCTTFAVKHKAPRRVRPVTIPREPATAPMVNLGREKVLSNFKAKLKIYEDLIRPDKCNCISHTTMSRLEDLADSLLDGDMFKAVQYSSKEIDAIVKTYGKKIKVNLPGMSPAGARELRKVLLAGVKEDLLKSDLFQNVSIRMDKLSKGAGGYYVRSKKCVYLSEKNAISVTNFCEALAKGTNPSVQTLVGMQTVMHEFGHHLQDWTPVLTKWAGIFFRNRTQGDKLTYWKGNKKIKIFKDKWADSYQGRVYDWESIGRAAGTEVVSMYNELASFLPWTEGMVKALKQPNFRRAWARDVLSKIVADPDGLGIMLQLVKGL